MLIKHRPACHINPDGKVGLPIGTLQQQLERAYSKPATLNFSQAQIFIRTLESNQRFRRDIAEILGVSR